MVGLAFAFVTTLASVAVRLGRLTEKLDTVKERSDTAAAVKEDVALIKQRLDTMGQTFAEFRGTFNLGMEDVAQQGQRIERLAGAMERMEASYRPPPRGPSRGERG